MTSFHRGECESNPKEWCPQNQEWNPCLFAFDLGNCWWKKQVEHPRWLLRFITFLKQTILLGPLDVLECFTEDGGAHVYMYIVYRHTYTWYDYSICFPVEPTVVCYLWLFGSSYFMHGNELQFFVRWPISATKKWSYTHVLAEATTQGMKDLLPNMLITCRSYSQSTRSSFFPCRQFFGTPE